MQSFEMIRSRLLQNAAGRFHRSQEDLSPEVRLFIDWMAWETTTLYRELSRSSDNIGRTIMRRITPDTSTRATPSHAIACALPKQAKCTLDPEEDLFTIPRLGGQAPHQIFFSPLLATPLVKATVKYLGAGCEMREPESQVAISARTAFHPGVLWLGIRFGKEMAPQQRLCLFLDWKTTGEERREELLRRLPLVRWINGVSELTTKTGFDEARPVEPTGNPPYLDAEYLHLYGIEKNIRRQYEKHFVTIDPSGTVPGPMPSELSAHFSSEQASELFKEPLLWIKLVFPCGFRPEEVRGTQIRLNCFPIVNRKLDKSRDFIPSNSGGIETCALSNAEGGRAGLNEMGAWFLGIQRIFTQKAVYRPVTYESFRSVPAGCYALQHGRVEADDFRDLQYRIAELSHLIETRAATMNLVPQNQISQALSSLETGADSLANAMQNHAPKDRDLGYYLHLKPLDPQDMIYVRFWTTQGVYADGAGAPGDVMFAENRQNLENECAWLVTGTVGGLDSLSKTLNR